jgi:hypothetical protein
MSQVIIYNQDNGTPAIVIPTPNALETLTIHQIGVKDVPAGKRFGIVNFTDLPTTEPQKTWSVSESDLNDGIGGQP